MVCGIVKARSTIVLSFKVESASQRRTLDWWWNCSSWSEIKHSRVWWIFTPANRFELSSDERVVRAWQHRPHDASASQHYYHSQQISIYPAFDLLRFIALSISQLIVERGDSEQKVQLAPLYASYIRSSLSLHLANEKMWFLVYKKYVYLLYVLRRNYRFRWDTCISTLVNTTTIWDFVRFLKPFTIASI